MRHHVTRLLRTALVATLVAFLSVGSPARSDDGDDSGSTEDLPSICRPDYRGLDGERWWVSWWFSNRAAILRPSYRARRSGGAPAAIDPLARDRARDALLTALGSKVELVSSEAALALGRAGDARDISALSKILRDERIIGTRRTHRYAALGIGLLPLGDAAQAAEARTALLGALERAIGQGDNFTFFWQNCAWALGMRGDKAALPGIVDLRRKGLAGVNLQSTLHADVLGALCYPLATLGGDDALPEILEHLEGRRAKDGGSKDTSFAACHALAQLRGARVLAALRQAASKADDEPLRSCACQALAVVADSKDDESAAVLSAALLKDRAGIVRQMAAIALGRLAHKTSAPTLLAALETASLPDRPYVVLGLALCARAHPDAAIEKALLAHFDDTKNEQELMALLLGAGLANLEAARPRVLDVAKRSKSPAVLSQACAALGLLGGGEEERLALRAAAARSGEFLVRRESSLALGLLRDPAIIAQLRDVAASEKESDVDRQLAAVCLGRVGDDTEIGFLVGLLEAPDTRDQLRACIAHALGLLLDRSEGAALGRVAADTLWSHPQRGQMEEPIFDVQRLSD